MSQTTVNWRVLGASVCGTSHQRRSQPCQDAWQAKVRDDGVLLAAVADGAGSASRSHEGAREAVNAAISALIDLEIPAFESAEVAANSDAKSEEIEATEDDLDTPQSCPFEAKFRPVLDRAKTAVANYAEAHSLPVRELASTLIVMVATSQGVVVAQIGDGAAVMADENGQLKALTQPQQGEYANQTTFLTSEGAIASAQISVVSGAPRSLAIFSDGLQRLALEMPQGTPYDRFFAPLFQFVAQDIDAEAGTTQLESFLNSPRVTQRSDDDLTLVLASAIAE